MFDIPADWTLFQHGPWAWLLLIALAMLIGYSKAGIAGSGIIVPVLFASVFPAAQSTGILLPMLVMGDVFTVKSYYEHTDWKYTMRPMPWALAGIGVGFLFFLHFQRADPTAFDWWLKKIIGAIVIGILLLGIWLKKQQTEGGETHVPTWVTVSMALLAGFTTMIANAAGPIMTVYLLAFAMPKEKFMATRGMIFLILNVIKIPLQYYLGNLTVESLALNFTLFPAIILGGILGVKTLKVMPEKAFRLVVQVLATLAALKLIVGG